MWLCDRFFIFHFFSLSLTSIQRSHTLLILILSFITSQDVKTQISQIFPPPSLSPPTASGVCDGRAGDGHLPGGCAAPDQGYAITNVFLGFFGVLGFKGFLGFLAFLLPPSLFLFFHTYVRIYSSSLSVVACSPNHSLALTEGVPFRLAFLFFSILFGWFQDFRSNLCARVCWPSATSRHTQRTHPPPTHSHSLIPHSKVHVPINKKYV